MADGQILCSDPIIKVGQLTSWLSSRGGGVPAVIRPLSLNLQKNFVDVRVFGLLNRRTSGSDADWKNLNVIGYKSIDSGMWGYAPQLVSRLLDAELSLLHVHGLWQYYSVACLRWAQKSRNPYIVSPHGMLDPWALNNSRLMKIIAAWVYENPHLKNAACLHALNRAEAKAIRSYGLTNPIAVIPNGVDLPNEKQLDFPLWRKKLPHGAKILLFLSRIHPKKGLPILLRAWKKIQPFAQRDGWYLIVAGWSQSKHEQELKTLAQALELSESILFVGSQYGRERDSTFQHADAFILPSLSEGLPMVVLEAWAFGLPVLMTDECNMPEGFKKGAALRLPLDVDRMADMIRYFIALNENEKLFIGQKGKNLVQEQFAWQKVATDMIDVYRWVQEGGIPPSVIDIQ